MKYLIGKTLGRHKKVSIAVLVALGIFPLLSFRLKGLSVFMLLALGIYAMCFKNQKLKGRLLLLNTAIFILYVLSLLYTSDLQTGIKAIETRASLLVIPLCFIGISANRAVMEELKTHKLTFLRTFFLASSVLAGFIMLESFSFINWDTGRILVNPLVNKLETDFYWFKDHPIYLSLTIAASALMIFDVWRNENKKIRLMLVIGFLIQMVALILMSRKGVLIAFLIAFGVRILMAKGVSLKTVLYTIAFLVLTSVLSLQLSKDTAKRFREVFDKKSYKKVEDFSSTSIRYYVYDCSLSVSKESLLIGFGVGDVKKKLKTCYEKVSSVLYQGNYNTHNQYLGILLYVGAIGLFIFLFSLAFNIHLFYKNKDYLALSFLTLCMIAMMFENILDRQNGVILFALFVNYFGVFHLTKYDEKDSVDRPVS